MDADLFRSLVEQIPAITYVAALDPESTTHYVSPQIESLLGFTPEDYSADPDIWRKHLHPEDLQRVMDEVHRAQSSGGKFLTEYRMIRRDGRVVWFRDEAVVVRDAAGRPRFLQGVMLDITDRKQTEEALRRTEERYRALAENTNDMPYVTDAEGILTYVGPQVRRYGLTQEDLTGRSFLEHVLPEDRERLTEEFERSVRKGEEFGSEFRIVGRDGRTWWLEDYGKLQRDASGRVTGIAGVLRDVTERKKSEETLRRTLRSLEDFRSIVNRSPAVVFLWRVAEDWPVEFVSDNVRQFGYTPEELISGEVSWRGITHPGDDRRLQAEVMDHLRRGVKQFDQQYRLFAKSGEVRWVDDRTVAVTDENGTVTHYQGIVLDVTDRKRAEEALRQERDRAQKYLDIAGVMFVAVDAEGKVILVNQKGSEVLGYEQEEIIGKNWVDSFLPPSAREEVRALIQKLMVGEIAPVEYHENPIQIKGGEERIIAWHNTVLRDEESRIVGALASGEDITERKRAEEALRESEQRFRDLAELLPQTIYESDATTRLTFVNRNAYAAFGYTSDDFERGLYGLDMLVPDDRERARRNAGAILRGEKPSGHAYTALRKDGTTFPAMFYSSRVMRDGKPVGIRGIIVDVTEQKRVEAALQERQGQLRTLAARLAVVEERERRRIAQSLHDGIGQLLAVAKMRLEQGARDPASAETSLREAQRLVEEAMGRTRSLSFELSPPVLHELGLEAGIEWLAEHMEEEHGLTVRLRTDSLPKPMSEEVQVLIFQAVRELLLNVLKHARATAARVSLQRIGDDLHVTVRDDGAGFEAKKWPERRGRDGGFGLFSIREQFNHLGGHVKLVSAPGEGTSITLVAPLETEAAGENW